MKVPWMMGANNRFFNSTLLRCMSLKVALNVICCETAICLKSGAKRKKLARA